MRLVLISLDACAGDDAQALLALPNIQRLTEQSVFCSNVETVYPTLTYPIHTSILTGCYPDKHGIGHNEIFDPDDLEAPRPWHWDEKDIRVPTLLNAAYRAGRETAALLWPVTGRSKSIRYNFPEVLALPGENQVLKVLRYGSFGWLIKNEIKWGKTRVSKQQPHLDRYATLLAKNLILREYSPESPEFLGSEVRPSKRRMRMRMPDVMALHLVDADAMKHQYGVGSKESIAAYRRLDEAVGAIVKTLEYRAALKDTVVCVVSDHGQREVKESVRINKLLKENGVPAKAQTLGFGAYIDVDRPHYSAVYEYLKQNMQTYRISHVYSREELRALHAPEEVLLAVEAQDGVEMLDNDEAEAHKSTHGFGLHVPQARTLLWLSGPMFKKNVRLEQARVVDIAPTLAEAIGLPFGPCDGRILKEAFVRDSDVI